MSEAKQAHIVKGLGAWLLEHCTVGIDESLFPILTSVWMFPVAFLLTLQFYFPGFGSGNARILGACMIVLQCYYCEAFGAGQKLANPFGFSMSCLYLFFNEVILHTFMTWLDLRHLLKQDLVPDSELLVRHKKKRAKHQEYYDYFARKAERKELEEAWNVYMDFRKTLRRAATVCLAQFGLFAYYLFELNGESKDDDSPGLDAHFKKNVSMVKFLFAVVLLMVAGDDEAGPAFSTPFWIDKLINVAEYHEEDTEQDYDWEMEKNSDFPYCGLFLKVCSLCCKNTEDDLACFVPMPPSAHIFIRMFLDFFVNAFARAIICGTAPIMLCVEGPLDFVKDATAVFFILKLDDIEDWVTLSESDSWNPLSEDTSYELRSIKDKGYRIEGLRKNLGFPTIEEIIEVEKKKERRYKPPRFSEASQSSQA